MCRSLTDPGFLLNFISSPDPQDEATLHQLGTIQDYIKALDKNALKGARLGVPHTFIGNIKVIDTFNATLGAFQALGAPRCRRTVGIKSGGPKYMSELLEVPIGVRTFADLIEFNKTHANLELPPPFYTDQNQYISSHTVFFR
jgi:amidase